MPYQEENDIIALIAIWATGPKQLKKSKASFLRQTQILFYIGDEKDFIFYYRVILPKTD